MHNLPGHLQQILAIRLVLFLPRGGGLIFVSDDSFNYDGASDAGVGRERKERLKTTYPVEQ